MMSHSRRDHVTGDIAAGAAAGAVEILGDDGRLGRSRSRTTRTTGRPTT
jgi:hypothetical protein